MSPGVKVVNGETEVFHKEFKKIQGWGDLPRPFAFGTLRLGVLPGLSITEVRPEDRPAYLEHFREREIHERTLRIPFPYTMRDADEWIEFARSRRGPEGRPREFAIREDGGLLIGGIGIMDSQLPGRVHQAEVGYWLAKPLWGLGIMTECVRKLTSYAFADLGYTRLTATVLETNVASARVLEKNGFTLEASLKNHYFAAGNYFDGKLYARLAD